MNDILYANWSDKSDAAIEKGIGLYIKEMRQRLNKTQSELAKQADISRSTLSLLERGESGTITTLIKILRVLNQLHTFKIFEIHKQVSPLALAKMEKKAKQRVRTKKENKGQEPTW